MVNNLENVFKAYCKNKIKIHTWKEEEAKNAVRFSTLTYLYTTILVEEKNHPPPSCTIISSLKP